MQKATPCGSPSKKRNSHYDYSSFCISFIIPLSFLFFPFCVSIIWRFHFNRSLFCIQFILLLHFNSSLLGSVYLTIHGESDMLLLLERMVKPQIKGADWWSKSIVSNKWIIGEWRTFLFLLSVQRFWLVRLIHINKCIYDRKKRMKKLWCVRKQYYLCIVKRQIKIV